MLDMGRRDRRWSILLAAALIVGIVGLAACGAGDTPSAQETLEPSANAAANASLEPITIGISMYLLVDDLEDPNPAVSSHRSEDGLLVILEGMNQIWGQANVRLELATLDTLVVDRNVLEDLGAGNIRAFFDRLGESIPFDDRGLINGFYTRRVGGANGITLLGTRSYLVIDEPSVHDERVSSHEVGHILGLRHALNDPDRLLYSGTNGMKLSPEEITLARNMAAAILKTQR